MYGLIARWTAKPGQEDVVVEALADLASASRAEPGCRAYFVCRSLDDPRVFELFEVYDDEDAYRAHAESEHFRRHAIERGIPALESRERRFFEVLHPAG